jgi:hypothetical protein
MLSMFITSYALQIQELYSVLFADVHCAIMPVTSVTVDIMSSHKSFDNDHQAVTIDVFMQQ